MVVQHIALVLAVVGTLLSQTLAKGICAGCPIEQDPTNFPVGKLHEALVAVNSDDEVKDVVSVVTQVVAGIKYTVVYETTSGKLCTATWVDAPWESKLPTGTKISCRGKRSVASGFEDVKDSEIPVVTNFGEFAVNSQTNGNRKVIVKMIKAQKKVGPSTLYKLKFLAKSTSCTMNQTPNKDCLNKEVGPREICESEMFMSSYLIHAAPVFKVLNVDCQKAEEDFTNFLEMTGQVTDGKADTDMDDSVQFAVQRINLMSNSIYLKGVYAIHDITEQVVAGTKYTFTVQLRDTDCRRSNANVELSKDCKFNDSKSYNDLTCNMSVWSQPWIGFKKVVDCSCETAIGQHFSCQ